MRTRASGLLVFTASDPKVPDGPRPTAGDDRSKVGRSEHSLAGITYLPDPALHPTAIVPLRDRDTALPDIRRTYGNPSNGNTNAPCSFDTCEIPVRRVRDNRHTRYSRRTPSVRKCSSTRLRCAADAPRPGRRPGKPGNRNKELRRRTSSEPRYPPLSMYRA